MGGPPEGQHLVHDRTLTCAFFTPSGSESEPSFLFSTGPYRAMGDMSDFSGAMVTDLFAHPYGNAVATAPGLTSLKPAVENLAPIALGAFGQPPATDSLARLFLTTFLEQPAPAPGSTPSFDRPSPYWITRYDPRTGLVGPVMPNGVRFSPSRARAFAGDASAGTLLDLDGSRDLTGVNSAVFVGEDFYYVDAPPLNKPGPPSGATLTRIKPNVEPEVLFSSSRWLSMTVVAGGQTPRLLVHHSPPTSALPGPFLLDLDTLASTPLPSDLASANFVSASPSGRWLLYSTSFAPSSEAEYPIQTLTLIDWATGARTDLSPPLIGAMTMGWSSPPTWRPRHDELWIETDAGTVTVTEPGDHVTAVSSVPGSRAAALQEAGIEWFSIFTRDGQHWFSRGSDFIGPVYISSVDDPTSPPVQLNPEDTWPKPYWSVGDGRLLVGVSVEDEARQELFLVDPAAGTKRALAGGGQVVAVGKSRALALLAWDGGRNCGTLTLIDLESGAQTLLAEDVYLATVDPGHLAEAPPDHDLLAPGTAVAFLSRGRFASPYDGLWVTLLP